MKYCKDCKWCEPTVNENNGLVAPMEYAKCAQPGIQTRSMVSGGIISTYCTTQRAPESNCAPEARLFEEKL